MSAKRFFFRNHNNKKASYEQLQKNHSFNEYDEDNEDEEDNDDDLEYIDEIPYSSSSVDRSSVGSIPWADDAIKQNQLEWEKIERMFSGLEPLPDDSDLRNEILDWQSKFPQLLHNNITPKKNILLRQSESFESNRTIDEIADNTLDDADTLSNISQDSLEAQDTSLDFLITTYPSKTYQGVFNKQHKTSNSFPKNKVISNTRFLEDDFSNQLRISTIPLQQRTLTPSSKTTKQKDRLYSEPKGFLTNSMLTPRRDSEIVLPAKKSQAQELAQSYHLKMPPIFNLLDPNRRFRPFQSNKSFVQLTKVQQAKSAAERQASDSLKQPWNTSSSNATNAITSRFYNNRNGVILPSLSRRQINNHSSNNPHVTFATKKDQVYSPLNSSSGSIRQKNYSIIDRFAIPSTQGRSISAAVHRSDFDQIYLPNSASTKYKVFK